MITYASALIIDTHKYMYLYAYAYINAFVYKSISMSHIITYMYYNVHYYILLTWKIGV